MEKTVEIGITPFNEENINFLNELFGVDQVTIVQGQQATTLNKTSEEAAQTVMLEEDLPETEDKSRISIATYIAAGVIAFIAVVMLFIKRRKA